jgi:hypothetical protein
MINMMGEGGEKENYKLIDDVKLEVISNSIELLLKTYCKLIFP